jgi:uncharacterized protein with PQ loop repeat
MDPERLLEVSVSIWGVAMAVSPGLQIRQMLQTRESQDVSIGYFAVLSIGFLLWALYGLSIDSRILTACNSVAFVFGMATMIVAYRLRRPVPESAP